MKTRKRLYRGVTSSSFKALLLRKANEQCEYQVFEMMGFDGSNLAFMGSWLKQQWKREKAVGIVPRVILGCKEPHTI